MARTRSDLLLGAATSGAEGLSSQLLRDLEGRNHILLLSPRRVGKTSLLLKLHETAWATGWGSAYVSVADCRDEAALVHEVVKAVLERDTSGAIRSSLGRSPLFKLWSGLMQSVNEVSLLDFGVKLRAPDAPDWRDVIDDLDRALAAHRGTWVIALDEFPIFVKSLIPADGSSDRAQAFLDKFRKLRQGRPDSEHHVRWILAGSIGLDNVARRYGLVASVNDLKIRPLGAFSPDHADEFVEVLGVWEDLELSAEVRRRVMERAEWLIPHQLKIIVSVMRDLHEAGRPVDADLVDRACAELQGHSYRLYFDHWSVRLNEDLGRPDADYANVLLRHAARLPEGVSRGALESALAGAYPNLADAADSTSWLLDLLERDGYLVPADGKWRFRSPLLRGYWQRRFDP